MAAPKDRSACAASVMLSAAGTGVWCSRCMAGPGFVRVGITQFRVKGLRVQDLGFRDVRALLGRRVYGQRSLYIYIYIHTERERGHRIL